MVDNPKFGTKFVASEKKKRAVRWIAAAAEVEIVSR